MLTGFLSIYRHVKVKPSSFREYLLVISQTANALTFMKEKDVSLNKSMQLDSCASCEYHYYCHLPVVKTTSK